MVSPTSNTPGQVVDLIPFNAAPASTSTNPLDSFAQQLESALESALSQSGKSSQFDISVQPAQGQESGSGQYLVTITTPPATTTVSATPAPSPGANSLAPPSSTATSAQVSPTTILPPASTAPAAETSSSPWLAPQMQDFANGWSALSPQQVAFQLANASGTGGGAPTATVPGTTLMYGDLNQTQQLALEYSQLYGTGGLTMQDYLTQNIGPQTAWNVSYNQAQQDPAVLAAVDPSYQERPDGVPMPIQVPA